MSSPAFNNPVPLPLQDRLVLGKNRKKFPKPTDVDPNEYDINPLWADAFQQQAQQQAASPVAINSVQLTDQSASVSATDFSGGDVAGGLYEVRVYERITQAAGATSTIKVTIGWTEGGVSLTQDVAAAYAGNLTTVPLTGPPLMIRVDAASPITYAVAYGSTGAPIMKYELSLVLLRMGL